MCVCEGVDRETEEDGATERARDQAERERETETETERERERQRQRERETERQRETETERQRETERDRERQRDRQREQIERAKTERAKRERERDAETDRHVHTATHRETQRLTVGWLVGWLMRPGQQVLRRNWLPKPGSPQRPLHLKFISLGGQLSSLFATSVTPLIAGLLGWRGVNYLFGGGGLALALCWAAFAKSAPTQFRRRSGDGPIISIDEIGRDGKAPTEVSKI